MSIARAIAAAVALVTTLLVLSAGVRAEPTRVVSINLCADQLLLALADPGQIASLSTFATDPTLSYLAETAVDFPHRAGAAETVVGFDPDLVLAGRFTRLATRQMLKRLGYRVVELAIVRTIAEARDQILQTADLLGHPQRGAALVAEIDAAHAGLGPSAAPRATAAIYQRRGYVTGGATLSSALMDAAGLSNVGGSLAGERGGFVPLERLVASPPDFLVVARRDIAAEDQGSALLAHPALAELFPPDRRLVLPERLTVCAGPAVAPALRQLAAELARVAPTR